MQKSWVRSRTDFHQLNTLEQHHPNRETLPAPRNSPPLQLSPQPTGITALTSDGPGLLCLLLCSHVNGVIRRGAALAQRDAGKIHVWGCLWLGTVHSGCSILFWHIHIRPHLVFRRAAWILTRRCALSNSSSLDTLGGFIWGGREQRCSYTPELTPWGTFPRVSVGTFLAHLFIYLPLNRWTC